MIENMINPKYKTSKIAQTMGRSVTARRANHNTSIQKVDPVKKVSSNDVGPSSEVSQQSQLSSTLVKVKVEAKDTRDGLSNILTRLVRNREIINAKKKGEKVNFMMDNLKGNIEKARVSKLADAQLQWSKNLMMNQMQIKFNQTIIERKLMESIGPLQMQKLNTIKMRAMRDQMKSRVS